MRLAFEPDLINLLATARVLLARCFIRRGDPESAFAVSKVNLRMFDELWTDHRDPVVAICGVLARLDLHDFQTGPASNSAPPSGDGDPLELLASSETEKRSAESWAELVACCLAASPAAINPAKHHLRLFSVRLVERTAWLRRSDKIDEAIRCGDRMVAFAQLIAARYPRNRLLTSCRLKRSPSWRRTPGNPMTEPRSSETGSLRFAAARKPSRSSAGCSRRYASGRHCASVGSISSRLAGAERFGARTDGQSSAVTGMPSAILSGFEIQKTLLCGLQRVGRTFIKFYDPVDRMTETPKYSRNINQVD